MNSITYTPAVGQKFHQDGSVRAFPGNTIISFVDAENNPTLFQQCLDMQQRLRESEIGAKFAYLPPDSFHMTVMDLLCAEVRTPDRWSNKLALSAPLKECDAFFLDCVPQIPSPQPLTMRYAASHGNFNIGLEPSDLEAKEALRHYRDQVADATGVRRANHETYQFHVSLAYQLIELNAAEEKLYAAFKRRMGEVLDTCRSGDPDGSAETITLPPPRLVFFDDMFRFVPEDQYQTLKTR